MKYRFVIRSQLAPNIWSGSSPCARLLLPSPGIESIQIRHSACKVTRKYTGRHQQYFFLQLKLQAWSKSPLRVFFCNFCKIFLERFFHRTPPGDWPYEFILIGKNGIWRNCINPFVLNVPFLCLLKTSEIRKGFWCFQGVEKGYIGNKWVNSFLQIRGKLLIFPCRLLLWKNCPESSNEHFLF